MSSPRLFFLSFLVFTLAIIAIVESRLAKPVGPRTFFVFGDSLVDFGNNNYIKSLARADRLPYGIDSVDGKPTGRFSNGLNIADLLAEKFGLAPILAYLNPNINGGTKLLAGANFASAGVGILNETGSQFQEMIRINDQLKYFQDYQGRVSELVGHKKAQKLVNQSLTLIVLGGNDFINNYFYRPSWNTLSSSMLKYSLHNFVSMLVTEYRKILMRMHEIGAGRVIVTSTGPMGCAPGEKALGSFFGECAYFPQHAADLYNPQLSDMIRSLNQELGSQVFAFANTIDIHDNFIHNPQAFGFVTSASACCGQGAYNGFGFCSTNSTLCPNRNEYVFWDAFHPTEKANRLIVKQLMKQLPNSWISWT